MDPDYLADREGLRHAVDLLCQDFIAGSAIELPTALPETGIGARVALDRLAPRVIGEAAKLGSATSFAHMDTPTVDHLGDHVLERLP